MRSSRLILSDWHSVTEPRASEAVKKLGIFRMTAPLPSRLGTDTVPLQQHTESRDRSGERSWSDFFTGSQQAVIPSVRMDMCRTSLYAGGMSKMIQIRDVPEHVHATLKARAAREGMSLSDFIKSELERTVERPTMREWLELTQRAKPISAKRSAAQIVRELREAR